MPRQPLRGSVRVPADKSISHRAAIVAAIAGGDSVIRNFSAAGDCAATLRVLAALGAEIVKRLDEVRVRGRGGKALELPAVALDCGRSGTTMRLMAGVLAAAPFRSTLTGDGQLLRRPMDRVAVPLRLMGADVDLRDGTWPPVHVQGGSLAGIEYRLPVASAQVKSAILLAGVQASGETAVMETVPARDHTERLLARAGACVERRNADGVARTALREQRLGAFDISIPGDLSSAAPLLAAAAMMPGSDLTVEEIGLNPTRIGFLTALRGMGGSIETSGAPPPGGSAGVSAVQAEEPGGSVRIRHAPLRAIAIGAEEIPALIDELPLLALVATQAEGVTEVRGAAELRVKESDRIAGLVAGLRSLGAEVEEQEDGFTVRGPTPLRSGVVDGLADHRLAMTFAVAGLVASGPVGVEGMGFVSDSFPGFHRVLEGLR